MYEIFAQATEPSPGVIGGVSSAVIAAYLLIDRLIWRRDQKKNGTKMVLELGPEGRAFMKQLCGEVHEINNTARDTKTEAKEICKDVRVIRDKAGEIAALRQRNGGR